MKPIRLFLSYSHEDEKFRKDLEKHLSVLRRNNKIAGWHDRKIEPGSEWKNEIHENLEQAQIILMLISADFVASDYCYDIETRRALEKHNDKNAVVIPIIIRKCNWLDTPLSALQALPKDAKPVSSYSDPDEAWVEVTSGIQKVVDRLLAAHKENLQSETPDAGHTTPPKSQNHDDLLIQFLSLPEHTDYWFSPSRIKTMTESIANMRELSTQDIAAIVDRCEALSQMGVLEATMNIKGNKVYRINSAATKPKEKWTSLSPT